MSSIEAPATESTEVVPKSTNRELAAKNTNFTESAYSMAHTFLVYADQLCSADVLHAGNPSKKPLRSVGDGFQLRENVAQGPYTTDKAVRRTLTYSTLTAHVNSTTGTA